MSLCENHKVQMVAISEYNLSYAQGPRARGRFGPLALRGLSGIWNDWYRADVSGQLVYTRLLSDWSLTQSWHKCHAFLKVLCDDYTPTMSRLLVDFTGHFHDCGKTAVDFSLLQSVTFQCLCDSASSRVSSSSSATTSSCTPLFPLLIQFLLKSWPQFDLGI